LMCIRFEPLRSRCT